MRLKAARNVINMIAYCLKIDQSETITDKKRLQKSFSFTMDIYTEIK